jgi:hypothetical protein
MRLIIATMALPSDDEAALPCAIIENAEDGACPAVYAAQYTVPSELTPEADCSVREIRADVLVIDVTILLKVGGADRGARVTVRIRYALTLLFCLLQP